MEEEKGSVCPQGRRRCSFQFVAVCFSTTDWQAFCGSAPRSRATDRSQYLDLKRLSRRKWLMLVSRGSLFPPTPRAQRSGGGGSQALKKVRDAVRALLLSFRRKTAELAPCIILTLLVEHSFYGSPPLRTLDPGTVP